MRLRNDCQVPDDIIIGIARYVAQQFKDVARLVYVQVDMDDEFARRHCVVTGDAFPVGGWRLGLNEKHLVCVHMPLRSLVRSDVYPRRQQTPGGPVIEFKSWDEEFAETLAHEFQHVRQFEAGLSPIGSHIDAMEVEAEQVGAVVLQKYRTWRDKFFPQAVQATAEAA